MPDSIDLFEPEGSIANDLGPPNVTFKSRKTRRLNKKAVEVCKDAHKRTAAGSIENIVTNKSMRLSNDFNPSHCFSKRLDDGQGPSRVFSRLNDGLPKDKRSFPSLREIGNLKRSRTKY